MNGHTHGWVDNTHECMNIHTDGWKLINCHTHTIMTVCLVIGLFIYMY